MKKRIFCGVIAVLVLLGALVVTPAFARQHCVDIINDIYIPSLELRRDACGSICCDDLCGAANDLVNQARDLYRNQCPI